MESALLDSGAVDEMKDLLTCSLCSKTLNEPRILPCFHSFCEVCLGMYVQRLRGGDKTIETFPCPTCQSVFTLNSNQDVADLSSSCFIKNMLEIMTIQEKAKASTACSRCQKPAINHCTTCGMFMCKKCSVFHDDWPTHKNHDVLSVEELSYPDREAKMKSELCCMKHAGKILEIYCETRKELCCVHCTFSNHLKQNHSCMAVSELAQKQRETLQSRCTTLDEKLSEGTKALNNICQVMKSLQKNAKTAKDQIQKQKENILTTVSKKLNEKAKKLKEKVDDIYSALHEELRNQYNEIKRYLDKVQASMPLPRSLLKRGSIEEILSSQKMIDEKIEKLANEKPQDLDAVNDGDIKFVPDDIGNVNVDEIVGKLGHVEDVMFAPYNLQKSSSILKGEVAFMWQLQEWLGEKCKWNLCYRASRDGWSAQNFHRHCDNKGPTVVLVKANDCIFGGYTDQHWELGCGYKPCNSPFLFSLRNKDNLAPFIANIKQGQKVHAIRCHWRYGPIFGGGHDLCISNYPETRTSGSFFGETYQLPPGYVCGSEEANNLLAGQSHFLTTEIEVFN